jgi:hypothetical protein
MNQIDPYQNHCNFTHQSSHPVNRSEEEDMVVWKEEYEAQDSQAIRIPPGDFPYNDSHDSADHRAQNTGVETIMKKSSAISVFFQSCPTLLLTQRKTCQVWEIAKDTV